MIINHKRCYRRARVEEYPPIGDQLDAVFKLAKHLERTGHELPADVKSWIDKCQKVKDKYPAL